MGRKGITMKDKELNISEYFYFDIFNGDLCINIDEDRVYLRTDIITKEKAKEIIEFLTKFVEGE